MYIINQLKNQFFFVKLNFNEIGLNGPRIESNTETQANKPELKKDLYSREAYLNAVNENANSQQKEQIGKGKQNLNEVFKQPYGVQQTIDAQQKQPENNSKNKENQPGPTKVNAEKLQGKDNGSEQGTEKEVKKIGQFDGIKGPDGKPLTAESYKKMEAKDFDKLTREQAFQLMQTGENRIDAESIKPGDTVSIGFPNHKAYLGVSAASFPTPIRTIEIDGIQYSREGKNGEFFDKDGHRAVIGNKDLKTKQEIKIVDTYGDDQIKKMNKEYGRLTTDAFKKYGVKEGSDQAKMIRASIERGISPEELNMWMNKDADKVKKLSSSKIRMLQKNQMYLERQGIIPKEPKGGEKAAGAETQKKTFQQIIDGKITDTNLTKKQYKGKDGKEQKALYSEKKLTMGQLEKATKGLDSFTMHIPKEGGKSDKAQEFQDIIITRKQTKEFGQAKSQFVYGSGDKKGQKIPEKSLEKAGIFITGEGVEKKK